MLFPLQPPAASEAPVSPAPVAPPAPPAPPPPPPVPVVSAPAPVAAPKAPKAPTVADEPVQAAPRPAKPRKPRKAKVAQAGVEPHLRPVLKWMGGKAEQAVQILATMDIQPHEAYHEPFVGGGAVFFALANADQQAGCRRTYRLSDANPRLIALYTAIRDDLDPFLRALERLPATNDPDTYRAIRTEFNAMGIDSVETAARMLWLNRACFNGMYRENLSGGFNIPIGDVGRLTFPTDVRFRAVSTALQQCTVAVQDFRVVLAGLGDGDVAYLDPPYLKEASKTEGSAGFAAYTGSFGLVDHQELDSLCRAAGDRGARIFVSAGAGQQSRDTYAHGCVAYQTQVRRSAGATAERRGLAGELLIRY